MTSHLIDKSLRAIQRYNPEDHLYLKVEGNGDRQYLMEVKVNWLGRILMWLGLGNACMKRVAEYMVKHFAPLCQKASYIDLKNLKTLTIRMEKYNKRHGNKIPKCELLMSHAFTKNVSLATASVNVPNSNSVVTKALLNPQPSKSDTNTTKPTGRPEHPPQLMITVTPPDLSLTPSQQPTRLLGVVEFDRVRSKPCSKLKKLLTKYHQYEKHFKAIIEAMTSWEVEQYAYSDSLDIFSMLSNPVKPNWISPIKYMCTGQIQHLIKGFLHSGVPSQFIEPVVRDILAFKPTDQDLLVDFMVKDKNFKSSYIKKDNTPIQNILKARYTLFLLRKNESKQLRFRKFLDQVCCKDSGSIAFLQDPHFVNQLSKDEKAKFAQYFAGTDNTNIWGQLPFLKDAAMDPAHALEIFVAATKAQTAALYIICKVNVEVVKVWVDNFQQIKDKFPVTLHYLQTLKNMMEAPKIVHTKTLTARKPTIGSC